MKCDCKNHKVKEIGNWERCPLENGGYTSFIVYECLECGGINGFPDTNLKIALDRGTTETKMTLRELIYGNPFTTPPTKDL